MCKSKKGFFNPNIKGEKIIADMNIIVDFSSVIKF